MQEVRRLYGTHRTSENCISLEIFKTDVQDFRKIRPLGFLFFVVVFPPELTQIVTEQGSFGLFGVKLLNYFIILNYIVFISFAFFLQTFCSSKTRAVFRQFGRWGWTLTSSKKLLLLLFLDHDWTSGATGTVIKAAVPDHVIIGADTSLSQSHSLTTNSFPP